MTLADLTTPLISDSTVREVIAAFFIAIGSMAKAKMQGQRIAALTEQVRRLRKRLDKAGVPQLTPSDEFKPPSFPELTAPGLPDEGNK